MRKKAPRHGHIVTYMWGKFRGHCSTHQVSCKACAFLLVGSIQTNLPRGSVCKGRKNLLRVPTCWSRLHEKHSVKKGETCLAAGSHRQPVEGASENSKTLWTLMPFPQIVLFMCGGKMLRIAASLLAIGWHHLPHPSNCRQVWK